MIGRGGCPIKSIYSQRSEFMVTGSGVLGGWRQGQEMEQDVVDSDISHRMLGNASLTKRVGSWLML